MKKIIYKSLVFIFSVVFLLTSCEDYEPLVYDPGAGFIQLERANATITENSTEPLVLKVLYGGDLSNNTNGIDVNFTIESSDQTRYNLTPSDGKVTILPGESSADIIITPIDNFTADGNVDITLSLNAGSLPVGLAGEGIFFTKTSITLIDNDCPIDIDSFVGTYSVDENFTAGPNSPRGLSDFFGESYQIELSLDPNDETGTKMIVNNSPGFNVYISDGTVLQFDTCGNNVTFDGDNSVVVALFERFRFDISSSYDEATNTIKCEGNYRGQYQFTLKKIQ